jgi:hypothetical protein
MALRLSALRTGRDLLPRNINFLLLVLISVTGWVNPKALCEMKDYGNWTFIHLTGSRTINLPASFDICKFRSNLAGNTLRLRYRDEPVNVDWGNSRCLFWECCETHKYTPWVHVRFLNFKASGINSALKLLHSHSTLQLKDRTTTKVLRTTTKVLINQTVRRHSWTATLTVVTMRT